MVMCLLQQLTAELVGKDELLQTFLWALYNLLSGAAGDKQGHLPFPAAAPLKPVNVQHPSIAGILSDRPPMHELPAMHAIASLLTCHQC